MPGTNTGSAFLSGGAVGGVPTAGNYDTTDSYNPTGVFDPFGTGQAGGPSQQPSQASLMALPSVIFHDPNANPASWGQTAQNYNNFTLYDGSTPGVGTSEANLPTIIGQIASKLGIKHQKGISPQEQIIRALAKLPGINLPKGKVSDEELFGQIVHSVDPKSALPGGQAKPKGLNDPNAWDQVAAALHVQTDTPNGPTDNPRVPWQTAATSLLTMSKAQIAQVQGQLLAGGFYDSKVDPNTGDPTLIKEGNVDNYTMAAFGNMLHSTVQYGVNTGTKQTWQDYLTKDATANGWGGKVQSLSDVLNASGATGKSPASVPVATQGQLAPSLRQAYELDLGFAPSADALAGFTQQYDAAQAIHAGDATHFVDQNNIPTIAGLAAPGPAAGNYAVKNNHTAYLGHQMSNTAALIQNAMRGDHPLNANPDLTVAGRPM